MIVTTILSVAGILGWIMTLRNLRKQHHVSQIKKRMMRGKQAFPQPLVITLSSVKMCFMEHFPLLFKVTKVNKQFFTITEWKQVRHRKIKIKYCFTENLTSSHSVVYFPIKGWFGFLWLKRSSIPETISIYYHSPQSSKLLNMLNIL